MAEPLPGNWADPKEIPARKFRCGHCDANVASNRGYYFHHGQGRSNYWAVVLICPFCLRPSYFEGERQVPGVSFGSAVQKVPPDVDALYNEARNCTASGANTAAVLASRKLLMHIAVDQGAAEGKSFLDYVEYLADNGFVPPHGKGWVDHIRQKGNEANHEIVLMGPADASELLTFAEMLLKFIYEFPSRVPAATATPQS